MLTVFGNSQTTVFCALYSYDNTNSNFLIARLGMTITAGGLAVDQDNVKITSESWPGFDTTCGMSAMLIALCHFPSSPRARAANDLTIQQGQLLVAGNAASGNTVSVRPKAAGFTGTALLLSTQTPSSSTYKYAYSVLLPASVEGLCLDYFLCCSFINAYAGGVAEFSVNGNGRVYVEPSGFSVNSFLNLAGSLTVGLICVCKPAWGR